MTIQNPQRTHEKSENPGSLPMNPGEFATMHYQFSMLTLLFNESVYIVY